MRIADTNQNLTEHAVQVSLANLIFVVEKSTAKDTIEQFFGMNTSTPDRMSMNYLSDRTGAYNICANQPVLPIAFMGTTGPNNIRAFYDAQGKINKVIFSVEVGLNGALQLDNNTYIALSTVFSDMKNLRVYAFDSHATDIMLTYNSIDFKKDVRQMLALNNVRQICLPPFVQLAEFSGNGKRNVQLNAEELADLATALNDVAVSCGKPLVHTLGSVTSENGQEVTKFFQGGTYYNVMSNMGYFEVAINTIADLNVMVQRELPLTAL